MIWEINMSERQDLFALPPLGQFGVLAVRELPVEAKIGKVIDFVLFNEVIARGSIVGIEKPRSDFRKTGYDARFKIHWMPISEINLKPIPVEKLFGLDSIRCPKKCQRRSVVYMTQKLKTQTIRYRRCPDCKYKWTTVEVFQGRLVAPRKSK